MTLIQLTQVKQWMRQHGQRHVVELQIWDLVLCCWLLGWAALPGLILLQDWLMLPVLLMGTLLPTAYVRWRCRMHRAGRLRCDWLCALQ